MIIIPATMFGAGGATSGGVYIGSQAGTSSPTVSPQSLGAVEGDLAVLATRGSSAPVSGSGVAWDVADTIGATTNCYYRELTSADLSATITVTGARCWLLGIYRGATSIVQVVRITRPAGSHTLTGYTKNVAHKGNIAFSNKDQTGGGAGNSTFDTPLTFAFRVMGTDSGSGNQARVRLYDRLTPPNDEYVNSTGFGVTAASVNDTTFSVYELR